MKVASLRDFGASGPDPDIVRHVDEQHSGPWVLVTMDLTIVEDYAGFEWDRYAIAWVKLRDGLTGPPVELAKADIVHRHAHAMRAQTPGDHHTYFEDRHFRSRPSLTSLLKPKV